jgi:hypothetical protein
LFQVMLLHQRNPRGRDTMKAAAAVADGSDDDLSRGRDGFGAVASSRIVVRPRRPAEADPQ